MPGEKTIKPEHEQEHMENKWIATRLRCKYFRVSFSITVDDIYA